jgi:hypothetical protein
MSRKFALVIILLIAFLAKPVYAQPTLPDIAGTLQKGVIVLTWECQYDGIKSIAVLRSTDSVHNYSTVGYVREVKKGVQVFVDGHPGAGKNWYQLYIVFSSGLTWNSNRIKIKVDTATLMNQQIVFPPNDSLQKMVSVREPNERPKISKRTGIVVTIDSGDKKGVDVTSIDMSTIIGEVIQPVTKKDSGTKFYTTNTTDANSVSTVVSSSSSETIKKKQHISISIDTDPSNANPYTMIKSRFIFTNPLTGHVNMDLPEVLKHHYSVKFFDAKNNPIVEIPKIMASPLIIDKRNFQNKGIYRFELRKDNSQFETGYITIY